MNQDGKFVATRVERDEELTPKLILSTAIRYLQEYGWVRHTYGRKGMGFCALGAVQEAFDDLMPEDAKYQADNRDFDYAREDRLYHIQHMTAEMLYECMEHAVTTYNDEIAGSVDEVLEKFRCAVERADRPQEVASVN